MKNIILILFVFLCSLVSAQEQNLFDEANKAYNEGFYEQAATSYLEILEKGVHSEALYFNLGNVYYKLNQTASSIYYYEKALLLNPKDPTILNNLSYAQNMTIDAIKTVPVSSYQKIYENISQKLTFDQWAYLAVFCSSLFVVCLLFYFFLNYSFQKRIAFIVSIVFLFCCVLTLSIANIEYQTFKKINPAIVFENEIIVKSEPNRVSSENFRLHEGTKVNIIETLDDWSKISIVDGQSGWVLSNTLKPLKSSLE